MTTRNEKGKCKLTKAGNKAGLNGQKQGKGPLGRGGGVVNMIVSRHRLPWRRNPSAFTSYPED